MTDSLPVPPTSRPDVRVVCVVYHPGDELATFARTLATASTATVELVIVDNGTDHTVAREVADEVGARLVRSGANLGYGGGANVGATGATAPWIVVANSDIEWQPGLARRARRGRPVRPPRGVRRPRAAQHRRDALPVGARAAVVDPGRRARAVRADLAGQPVDPPVPRARAGRRRRADPPGGSRGRACCCGARRSRRSAGSTTATSCSSRTSTSASGSAAPGGPTSTSRRCRSRTSAGTSWRARPAPMISAHHASAARYVAAPVPALVPVAGAPGGGPRPAAARTRGAARRGVTSAGAEPRVLPDRRRPGPCAAPAPGRAPRPGRRRAASASATSAQAIATSAPSSVTRSTPTTPAGCGRTPRRGRRATTSPVPLGELVDATTRPSCRRRAAAGARPARSRRRRGTAGWPSRCRPSPGPRRVATAPATSVPRVPAGTATTPLRPTAVDAAQARSTLGTSSSSPTGAGAGHDGGGQHGLVRVDDRRVGTGREPAQGHVRDLAGRQRDRRRRRAAP